MRKKFGIIGNPIAHSLSPLLHNYWFEKYELDATYSIINVEENNLNEIVKKIRNKELSGINVTLPFKQKIVPYLDVLINDAEITSSVNTLYLDSKNFIVGENTDVFGLQAAYLKEVDNISKKKALVIGAGGVSPSVILSLQKSGLKNISVTNRTIEKCFFLKKKFNNLNIVNWSGLKEKIQDFDIMINATSLGLKNGEDFSFNFVSNTKNNYYIKGDSEQLYRAFLNLIKNSIEAINEKKQKDSNLLGKIDVEINKNNEYIEIKMLDNGPGFNDTTNILKPYYTTKKDGTGLGLPIVTKIINEHNGEIEFVKNSKGAEININIPSIT